MSIFSSRHRHDSSSTKGETSSEPEFVPPEESLEKSLESTIRQRTASQASTAEESSTNGSTTAASSSDSTLPLNLDTEAEPSEPLAPTQSSMGVGEGLCDDEAMANETVVVDDEPLAVDDVFLKVPNNEDQPEVHVSPEHNPDFDGGNNITDEEKVKAQRLTLTTLVKLQQAFTLTERPFLEAVFNALECMENDHAALFALCLLYALGHNAGINQDLLDSVLMPTDRSETKQLYNVNLVERLIKIIAFSCQYNSRVRLATLQMSLLLLKQLVVKDGTSFLQDRHLAAIEQAREESTLLLRNFYKSEEIFLDMFEDEYQDMMKKPLNVEYLMMDANLLLPPTGTPMSGIGFDKRLPCGEVERARRTIRVFFLLRDLSLTLRDEPESQLPLTNISQCIQTGDVLDHNNSDLLGCIVVTKDGTKVRRFMVIDILQLILVEPDPKRIGWGVTKFVGFLQDIEVTGDKDDSRCLHITVHRPAGAAANSYSYSYSSHNVASSVANRLPLLAARFVFDDNIRCMAAKQRLTKGRLKARQRKMHQIARLLELPDHIQPCPSPMRHSLRPSSIAVASVSSNELAASAAIPRSHSQDAGLRGRTSSTSSSSGPHPSGHHHHYHHHHHHGIYRPLFSSNSKVPGFATALRQDGRNMGNSPPNTNNGAPPSNVVERVRESSSDRHRRVSGSPVPTKRRVSSGTRSREPSPRVRTHSSGGGSSSGGSEEIPLEDMSKGRGSRHNSPNLRRRSSSGLPQARICAPPYLPHVPLSNPSIASHKRTTDEEEEDVFQDESSSAIRSVRTRTDLKASGAGADGVVVGVPPCSDSEGESPSKECTKPCCAQENSVHHNEKGERRQRTNQQHSRLLLEEDGSRSKTRKTKGAIQTV